MVFIVIAYFLFTYGAEPRTRAIGAYKRDFPEMQSSRKPKALIAYSEVIVLTFCAVRKCICHLLIYKNHLGHRV